MQKALFPGYTVGPDAYEDIVNICPAYGKRAAIIGGKHALAAAEDKIRQAVEGSGIEIIGTFWYGGEASRENMRSEERRVGKECRSRNDPPLLPLPHHRLHLRRLHQPWHCLSSGRQPAGVLLLQDPAQPHFHQHGDHCNVATLKRLLSEHPLIRIIYPNYLCKKLFSLGDTSFQNNSFIVAQDKWYSISNITFSAVPLRHDVPNIGWKLHFNTQQGIYKVIYATDTSEIAHITAKNYDLYLVEANYSKTELLNRIKDKRLKGQYVYEDRVRRSHLSKDARDEWLYKNMGNNSFFVYMHQHEDLV